MRWTALRGCVRRGMRSMPDTGRTKLSLPMRATISISWSRCAESGSGSRSARYHCVLAFAKDGVYVTTTEGSVEGEILETPRGTGGFGYDPLFYLPELGKSMAEIDLETKLG